MNIADTGSNKYLISFGNSTFGYIDFKTPDFDFTVSWPINIKINDMINKRIMIVNVKLMFIFIKNALIKEPSVNPIIVHPLVAIADNLLELFGVVSIRYAATQLDASPHDNP